MLKQRFLPKMQFLDISSQNYAKASLVFHNIAKLKSITMQIISDFIYFDTIALRQKNAIWKVDGYNIGSVYTVNIMSNLVRYPTHTVLGQS